MTPTMYTPALECTRVTRPMPRSHSPAFGTCAAQAVLECSPQATTPCLELSEPALETAKRRTDASLSSQPQQQRKGTAAPQPQLHGTQPGPMSGRREWLRAETDASPIRPMRGRADPARAGWQPRPKTCRTRNPPRGTQV